MKIYNQFLNVGKSKIAVQLLQQSKTLKEENTLVMLHEGLGSIEMWKDWPERLAKKIKLNLVVYSRLGMGKSSQMKKKKTINFLHEEALYYLPKIIKNFCQTDPILLGHSDGASISLIYAGNQLPCKGIILEAPHVIVEKITLKEIKKIKINWESNNLEKKLMKYHENPKNAFFSWCDIWLSKKFVDWNITNLLPSITAPILVIQGKEDQYGTLKQVNLIKKNCLTKVDTLILNDCRHSPHLEYSDKVIEKVNKFIKNILSND